MDKLQKISLALLRLSLGWIFFYSSIIKISDPAWTSQGYLKGATTLNVFFSWFASPQNIGLVNFANEWGQFLIGVSLITGLLIKISSPFGILLMLLYYLPILNFPYVGKGTGSFLIDQHIIFIGVFLLLFSYKQNLSYTFKALFPKKLQKYL